FFCLFVRSFFFFFYFLFFPFSLFLFLISPSGGGGMRLPKTLIRLYGLVKWRRPILSIPKMP
ncbi:MAG TPA: hypothetical protein DCF33_11405, partial [Saprospirales bacterium]|nr:hypothetical protein [Saprospirales bacterium]